MKTIIAAGGLVGLSALSALAEPIEVVGTGDGMELVRAVAAAYTADYPDQVILVPPSIGSGGGIAAVGAGKARLARVARPLKPAEKANGLTARAIFRLPTAIYTHPQISLDGLTHGQLVDIYKGRITNWGAVGGPDLRIKVVRREDTDSSLAVLRSSMPGWETLEFTPRSRTAVTTQDAVETVRAIEGAIGFGPFSRTLESQVNVLAIGGVRPGERAYPSAVTIAYVWRTSDASRNIQAFVDYGHSPRVHALLKAYGAVPVTPSQ